jgi:hypothetical protein
MVNRENKRFVINHSPRAICSLWCEWLVTCLAIMWIVLNFIILLPEVLRWFNSSWRSPICFVVCGVRRVLVSITITAHSREFRARLVRLIRLICRLFSLLIILLCFASGWIIIDPVSTEHARAMHWVTRITSHWWKWECCRIYNDGVFLSTCVTKPIGHWVNTIRCHCDKQWYQFNHGWMHDVEDVWMWLCSRETSDELSAHMLPAAECIEFTALQIYFRRRKSRK